jgi:hypothetical protein
VTAAGPFRRAAAAWGLAAALWLTAGLAAAQTGAPAEPGTFLEIAIVLPGITSEMDGVRAEHAYIAQHLPGWRLQRQSLISHNNRHYDRLELIGPNGAQRELFFDITDWFGK